MMQGKKKDQTKSHHPLDPQPLLKKVAISNVAVKFLVEGEMNITAVCKKAGQVTETKKFDLKTFESYLTQF